MNYKELPKTTDNLQIQPKLLQEDDNGNIEYKIHIINLDTNRYNKLLTQMAWRIQEGRGTCYYYIGIEDTGIPSGIDYIKMKESLNNIDKLCTNLNLQHEIIDITKGITGGYCARIFIINNNSAMSY